jgi:predicted DNA-binding transcriptional regulator AlpA
VSKSQPDTFEEIDRAASVHELVPRLIDADQIADLLHVSKRHFARLVHVGEFPKPVRIGGSSRWPASDYNAYVERLRVQRESKRRGRNV